MQVPRVCPAGYVCEFTGTTLADNPCPEGHFCLEGTATSATSCGHPGLSSELFPTLSHAERSSTLRRSRIAQGQELFLGARNTGCWTNETDDFGLQVSICLFISLLILRSFFAHVYSNLRDLVILLGFGSSAIYFHWQQTLLSLL